MKTALKGFTKLSSTTRCTWTLLYSYNRHLVVGFSQSTSHVSDEAKVVTSLPQVGQSIGNVALQAGEVTKEMERAKKRGGLTTNLL